MRRHLHHLNALRCFEAAARLLSFTQAAAELHVTQAAVSHQVRALEQALGQPLFERRPRQVRLTAAGERLVGVLSNSFDRIDELLGQLKQSERQAQQSLQLAVTPSFSSRWLMPRLPRFWDAHPEIELHLHHSTQGDALSRGTAEAAVVWALEPPPRPAGLWAQRLFGTALTPVCSPALPRQTQPLDSPAALRHYPLLHEDSHADWARWMRAAGLADMPVHQGQLIDDSNALLMAAMAGRGLALGRLALIEDELRAGRLLRPFALSIAAEGAYWLLAAPTLAERPHFQALAAFMQAECIASGMH
ncbi:LysR substrate-binding domain-containing protein [Paucibacter soli]|uniref:LysR substrate-binding domain-containing protein n=1 Tax=Paucibacter soli TaxID=3133433 RepID=UPI00309C3653